MYDLYEERGREKERGGGVVDGVVELIVIHSLESVALTWRTGF